MLSVLCNDILYAIFIQYIINVFFHEVLNNLKVKYIHTYGYLVLFKINVLHH